MTLCGYDKTCKLINTIIYRTSILCDAIRTPGHNDLLCSIYWRKTPCEDSFGILLVFSYFFAYHRTPFLQKNSAMANLHLKFSWGISNYRQRVLFFLPFIHLIHTASLASKILPLSSCTSLISLSTLSLSAFWLRLVRNTLSKLIENRNLFNCILIRIGISIISWAQIFTSLSLIIFFRTITLLKIFLYAIRNRTRRNYIKLRT